MKIVVAEDSKSTNKMMVDALKSAGHDVFATFNGTDTLQVIFKEIPALVFLDIILPDLDGRDICNKIRNNPQTKHIQIVVSSSRSSEYDQRLYLELGADDFLAKPFNDNLLLRHVQKAKLRIETYNTC